MSEPSLFSPDHPVCFAQARKGEVIVTQGHGQRAKIWRPCTTNPDPTDTSFIQCHPEWKVSGTEAPPAAPDVKLEPLKDEEDNDLVPEQYFKTYYVARLDILDSGGGLTLPPIVKIDPATEIEGYVVADAEGISRIQQQRLSELVVTEYGRHYSKPPIVYLNDVPSETTPNTAGDGAGFLIRTVITETVDGVGTYQILGVYVTAGGSGYSNGDSRDPANVTGNPPRFRILHKYPDRTTVVCNIGVKVVEGVVQGVIPDPDNLPPDYESVTDHPTIPTESKNRQDLQEEIVWDQVRTPFSHDGSTGEASSYGRAQAIMRATLRGKYQCYYRYVNDKVPEEEGGPLYSNLSEATEIDSRDGASRMIWTLPAPIEDCKIELWRGSANQFITVYKVATLEASEWGSDTELEYIDDLNDHELMDPDRDGFAAMPILLPNGELNANRFGVMDRNGDFAVSVMFQDRLWYGVDTSNNRPNSLMFSETDEPESCPDINEIIIQQNLRSADYITALIPYAGALLACQSRHIHRLTYVSQPLIDVATFLLAYRGCCNQRCWDIYEGVAYIMDDQGVYSLDPQGKLEPLTVGIDNLFSDEIDWNNREWFIVRADRQMNILRCSVSFKGDKGKYPTRQLCYSLDFKAWWMEVYPSNLVSSTDLRADNGNVERIWGTSAGGVFRIGKTLTDHAVGAITSVEINDPGRGYKRPPTITADPRDSDGSCAEFTASINTDGEVVGIYVRQCGLNYPATGDLIISGPEEGTTCQATYKSKTTDSHPVYYSFKSGNMEFLNDSMDEKANQEMNRQVEIVYQPTDSSSIINLETYYNGAAYPRCNVVTRDRGTGFVHSQDVPAATLDMQKTQIQDSEAHGVARALFSGRTIDDMSGTDRHVAVGLSGQQSNAGRVTLHVVDIYGVNQAE